MKKIVFVVVGALASMFIQQHFFDEKNEIQKIDIHTNFDRNYLSKPKFPDSKVEIKVDGSTKESIGILEVSLINFSNKVFQDVPIIIEVEPKRGDSFTYLSHFAHGEKGLKDLVEVAKPYEFVDGVHRFFYTAKSLNRSEEADIGMKLGILFEGEQEPDITVSAIGLSTREFNIEHSPARAKVKRDAWFIVIGSIVFLLVLVFAIFSPIMSRLVSPFDRMFDKQYSREIFDVLRKNSYYDSISNDDLRKHVTEILFEQKDNCWKEKSFFGRWFLGMRAPAKSDYEIKL